MDHIVEDHFVSVKNQMTKLIACRHCYGNSVFANTSFGLLWYGDCCVREILTPTLVYVE